MHHEGSFEIPAPKEKVYAFLMDPEKVTSIFPDVSNIKVIDENNFTLKAKIGISFVKGNIDVKLTIAEKNEPKYAKLKARGTGLSSSVDLETAFNLEDGTSGGSIVKWSADARVSGLLASVGARLIDTAAEKYIKDIASSLQKKLSQ
jgi:carbon monoxide dehydrogenase subunit G